MDFAKIPESFDDMFDSVVEKVFAEGLIAYLIYGIEPEITPAIWQDVEILIRYKKRDVWHIDEEERVAGFMGLMKYRLKYVIQNMTKVEILKTLNGFFDLENHDGEMDIIDTFSKKIHIDIDDLITVQEEKVITKDMLEDFDKLFEYPGWIRFDGEAEDIIIKKIMKGEMTDEQIDYFLGASDDMHDYAKWFKVAKHVLLTTKNAHTFWSAGDVLSVVRKTDAGDKKIHKWFNDEIYEIFWSRVESTWPMLHGDLIEDEDSEEGKILDDAISWLRTVDDLKKRLPELGDDYELIELPNDEDEFVDLSGVIMDIAESGGDIEDLLETYFEAADYVANEEDAELYERLGKKVVMSVVDDEDDKKTIRKLIDGAVDHAKKYVSDLEKERKIIKKLVV